MKKLLLTFAVVLAAVGGAAAEDEYPYREDGPMRDVFVQSSTKNCIASSWKNFGSETELKAFCQCKALHLAENWSQDDEDEWYRSQNAKEKTPGDLVKKMRTGQTACLKHFSKLPKAPSRK